MFSQRLLKQSNSKRSILSEMQPTPFRHEAVSLKFHPLLLATWVEATNSASTIPPQGYFFSNADSASRSKSRCLSELLGVSLKCYQRHPATRVLVSNKVSNASKCCPATRVCLFSQMPPTLYLFKRCYTRGVQKIRGQMLPFP